MPLHSYIYSKKNKHSIFVFPYYPHCLHNLIKESWTKDWQFIKLIFAGIWKGLAGLHNSEIIHFDLKPLNIMLTKELSPIIIDFDLAFN